MSGSVVEAAVGPDDACSGASGVGRPGCEDARVGRPTRRERRIWGSMSPVLLVPPDRPVRWRSSA
ncbi:hypothetical protein HMPREF9056_01427 [Actinomyces sp. oral taxon 170 str. F0386]|nr:hypothetical protein HMPREF9056_01427 [Actinomyces sp. oral taxon 170 str. F0386]